MLVRDGFAEIGSVDVTALDETPECIAARSYRFDRFATYRFLFADQLRVGRPGTVEVAKERLRTRGRIRHLVAQLPLALPVLVDPFAPRHRHRLEVLRVLHRGAKCSDTLPDTRLEVVDATLRHLDPCPEVAQLERGADGPNEIRDVDRLRRPGGGLLTPFEIQLALTNRPLPGPDLPIELRAP